MSGHNKWSQIKHRKGAADKKKSLAFSKVLVAVSIAARPDPNPATNPRLRSLIEQAKAQNVPKENIERALSRASDKELKEFTIEAYGPEGVGIIIETITDNSNRTMQEVRNVLVELESKVAEIGSVRWAFEQVPDPTGAFTRLWRAKFPQKISEDAREHLEAIVGSLEELEDVQKVTTSAAA